ncbi:hypothetical protein ACQP3F_31765, partial [Escherichia coli]
TCFEEGVLPPAKVIRKMWRLQRKRTTVGGFFIIYQYMNMNSDFTRHSGLYKYCATKCNN